MGKIVCSICADRLFDMDFIISTACCHVYHEKCINEWMKKSQSCPDCREACSTESNRRLFFNYDSTAENVVKKAFQQQIIDLKKELETQKKSLEEALCCEMEIRLDMHKENKKLKDRIITMEQSLSRESQDSVIEILDSPTPPTD